MLSAPSSPTVGEETRLERPALGLVSVFLPCLALGISAALTRARPRRQRPVARAGDHAGRNLAGAGRGGVRLHAPLPAARALVNVGFGVPSGGQGLLWPPMVAPGCSWPWPAWLPSLSRASLPSGSALLAHTVRMIIM